MRTEISGLVKGGKSRDEVVQYYITKYGSQEPLAEPLDQGFNRLAWGVPYLAGLGSVLVIGLVLVRWSKRPPAVVSAGGIQEHDPLLEAQLNDELRNLD
jgi:cytochrome c-type biogenesis protein CcmH/NrfF